MKNTKETIANEKLCAALSYILIGIVWYFADEKMKKSQLARYHAKQGLVFLIAWIVYAIVLQILFTILFPAMIFGGGLWAGFGFYSILRLLGYIPLIWAIIGVINALNGNIKALPIIGQYGEKFSF